MMSKTAVVANLKGRSTRVTEVRTEIQSVMAREGKDSLEEAHERAYLPKDVTWRNFFA